MISLRIEHQVSDTIQIPKGFRNMEHTGILISGTWWRHPDRRDAVNIELDELTSTQLKPRKHTCERGYSSRLRETDLSEVIETLESFEISRFPATYQVSGKTHRGRRTHSR